MEVNPLRRVLKAKARAFFGLAMLVAVVMLVIASMDSVGQAGAAQKKPKPQPKSRFGAREVIATDGSEGFPITGTYKSKGGTLLISAAGSGYSDTGEMKIGVEVFINGRSEPVGTAQVYTNEKDSHKAFVPAFEVVNKVPKGRVDIELKPLAGTKIDQNDFFRVTVEEQPRG
jgi:hypothetical protein